MPASPVDVARARLDLLVRNGANPDRIADARVDLVRVERADDLDALVTAARAPTPEEADWLRGMLYRPIQRAA